MKLTFLFILVLSVSGCTLFSGRTPSTSTGIIADYFGRQRSEVRRLAEQGLAEDKVIKILLISTSSYLTENEVIEMMDAHELVDIAAAAGLDPDTLKTRTARILKSGIN